MTNASQTCLPARSCYSFSAFRPPASGSVCSPGGPQFLFPPGTHTSLPHLGRIHQFLLLQISSLSQTTVVTDCDQQDVAGGTPCRLQAQPRSSLAASALMIPQLPRCKEALLCCCRKGVWRTQEPSLWPTPRPPASDGGTGPASPAASAMKLRDGPH